MTGSTGAEYRPLVPRRGCIWQYACQRGERLAARAWFGIGCITAGMLMMAIKRGMLASSRLRLHETVR